MTSTSMRMSGMTHWMEPIRAQEIANAGLKCQPVGP